MNVHQTCRIPGCLAAPVAVLSCGGASLPAQGVCVVEPPRNPAAAGASLFEASFAPDPAAVSGVRRRLRACLVSAGLEHVVDDVLLVCQELMANAILHGCRDVPRGTTPRITVTWSNGRLHVDVTDPADAKPTVQKVSLSRASGRGLHLVKQLSDRWGVKTDPVGGGKTVWAETLVPGGGASTAVVVELGHLHPCSGALAQVAEVCLEGPAT